MAGLLWSIHRAGGTRSAARARDGRRGALAHGGLAVRQDVEGPALEDVLAGGAADYEHHLLQLPREQPRCAKMDTAAHAGPHDGHNSIKVINVQHLHVHLCEVTYKVQPAAEGSNSWQAALRCTW